jgi:hypothetical protein
MNNELLQELLDVIIDDVPASAALKAQSNRYGSIDGLDDDELADPEELERVAFQRDFEPVLSLPVKRREGWVRPNFDEGAFGTVDFDRLVPEFDKVRYKAEKLREELRDLLITISIVKERLPSPASDVVLKHLKTGLVQMEHLSEDMQCLAKLVGRADRLKKRLQDLQKRRKGAAALGGVPQVVRLQQPDTGDGRTAMQCMVCGGVKQDTDLTGPLCLRCDKRLHDAREDAWQEAGLPERMV